MGAEIVKEFSVADVMPVNASPSTPFYLAEKCESGFPALFVCHKLLLTHWIYFLKEPLTLSAEDSGRAFPIVWRGAGKAIISTPYWHAAELLDDGRGELIPFKNPDAIATAAIELLDNDAKRQTMRKRAYLYARKMVWNRVAQSYMRSFMQAHANGVLPAQLGFSVQTAERSAASQRPNAYAEL